MKYFIITYGCQMNKSDSERIAGVLENMGYQPASKINEADLIVVNMCSVRQTAVDRVYGLIPQFEKLKAENNNLKTVLTGCYLKNDLKKFKKHFDYLLSIEALSSWPEILKGGSCFSFDIQKNGSYLKIKPKYQTNFRVLIPISNGCNNFCSYCVVPYARGPEICRNHRKILKEAEIAVQKGFREIWLLGQNINSYQSPASPLISFARLLRQINDIPGNFWVRFTSPHPRDFSKELIEIMAQCEKVTPYLNLPVQSGDNEILKKMRRPYTIKQYKNLVKKIRKTFKKYRTGLENEIALSTDIIVGFPGETKKQYQNTVKLFKEIRFDMAYIAKFSPRPGTAAAKMKDNVPHQEKEKRDKFLTEILKQTALENNKRYIGEAVEVLVNEQKSNFLIGKTRTYKTVKFEGPRNLIGQFIKIKITNINPFGLKGELI